MAEQEKDCLVRNVAIVVVGITAFIVAVILVPHLMRDKWESYNMGRVIGRLEEADRLQQTDPLAAYKTYDAVLKEAQQHTITDEGFASKLAVAEQSRAALYEKVEEEIKAEERRREQEEAGGNNIGNYRRPSGEESVIAFLQPDTMPPLAEGVVMRVEAIVTPSNYAAIRGQTNLPTGTHLMFSIKEVPTGAIMQDKGVVGARGLFKSDLFGPTGGLDSGKYTAQAMMPLSFVQPDSVREVIGMEGEHLKGPLVRTDSARGATVYSHKDFVVGDDKGVEKQRERHQLERDRYSVAYSEAERLFREIEGMRTRNADPTEWAEFLRSFNPRVQSFEQGIRDASVHSAGHFIRETNLAYIALKANPYRSTYSRVQYDERVAIYHEYMAEAKKRLEKLVPVDEFTKAPRVAPVLEPVGRTPQEGGLSGPDG